MLHYNTHIKDFSAEWVVFLHGFGGNSGIFYRQIKLFAERFNLLLIDLRGHGHSAASQPTTQKYTYSEIAVDVLKVIDFLKLKRCHFVGCSLGTIVVRKIALIAPERVISMEMAGAVVGLNLRSKFLMHFARQIQHFVPYMLIYSIYSKILMPRKRHRFSRSMFVNNAVKMGQREFMRWFELTAKLTSFLRLLYSKEPNIPTLYLMGDEDYMFLPQVQALLAKYHTEHSQLAVVPNAGHVCNIDNADFFNKSALSFLEKINSR